jgi:hypothetical protein
MGLCASKKQVEEMVAAHRAASLAQEEATQLLQGQLTAAEEQLTELKKVVTILAAHRRQQWTAEQQSSPSAFSSVREDWRRQLRSLEIEVEEDDPAVVLRRWTDELRLWGAPGGIVPGYYCNTQPHGRPSKDQRRKAAEPFRARLRQQLAAPTTETNLEALNTFLAK